MTRKLTDKKVLVTGGAGFIGSNLCESLLSEGNTVFCLDNLATGKHENVAPFLSNPNFIFTEGDIRDYPTCLSSAEGMDVILHQAALGSVPRSINDPLTTNSVNIDGFLNMLNAAKEKQVGRFIYAASSSTYGDSLALPKVEDQIGMPLSPYAVTKYVNELYANVFANLHGMEIIGLRYFNVFGRNQSPGGAYAAAIPKFVSAFLSHESPIIHGDGEQTRDFTYINNVIQMNHLAATTDNPEALNQVYNVACGQRTSLNDLITSIRTELSKYDSAITDIEVQHGPERAGDVRDSLADISKAKNLLGYEPTHTLKEGIAEAIEWYRNTLK
ncbi:SDR family oxidoreductase [Cryomorphaceae bacterium 1068]|nr:SDR family oxidoreductase [Cryomorphaceae bacterium 1068]